MVYGYTATIIRKEPENHWITLADELAPVLDDTARSLLLLIVAGQQFSRGRRQYLCRNARNKRPWCLGQRVVFSNALLPKSSPRRPTKKLDHVRNMKQCLRSIQKIGSCAFFYPYIRHAVWYQKICQSSDQTFTLFRSY